MATRVVNIRDLPRDQRAWPADHVYIGRGMPNSGWGTLQHSIWANPFVVGARMTRDDAVEAYRDWLMARRFPMARIGDLRGKTLVCWCAPERCHGDVLAWLIDG